MHDSKSTLKMKLTYQRLFRNLASVSSYLQTKTFALREILQYLFDYKCHEIRPGQPARFLAYIDIYNPYNIKHQLFILQLLNLRIVLKKYQKDKF